MIVIIQRCVRERGSGRDRIGEKIAKDRKREGEYEAKQMGPFEHDTRAQP